MLSGIKVIEFAGLAPGPFCGLILADFGANVIRVDRITNGTTDLLARGKRSIAVDIKNPKVKDLLLQILAKSDVLIDPFRPGVMEKLGLGPEVVLKLNPRLIYTRITGFGQTGKYSNMAGHDINYISLTGALSVFGRKGDVPLFPANLLADFAGGGMLGAIGVLLALFERERSGNGQVIDVAMIDGAAYMSSFIFKMKQRGLWNEPTGENTLDSGAPFYEVYKTKDSKYMAVGAIESQFYAELIHLLDLDATTLPNQMDTSQWPNLKLIFSNKFAQKTRKEWESIFTGTNACVTPVLEMGTEDGKIGHDVMALEHNKERKLLVQDGEGNYEPVPAPRFSRTHPIGERELGQPEVGEHTVDVLRGFGIEEAVLKKLIGEGGIMGIGYVKSRI